MLNQMRFSKFSGRFESFEEICKIPREVKCNNEKVENDKFKMMNKKHKGCDKKLSYKNRRTINKDFKDFMNNQ